MEGEANLEGDDSGSPPFLLCTGGAQGAALAAPPSINRGEGQPTIAPVTHQSLPPPLSSTASLLRLGEALQLFSSTTTTTPSCCWDSEGIYHTSAARWNGERTGFIDTVRATEYGSVAGLQHWG